MKRVTYSAVISLVWGSILLIVLSQGWMLYKQYLFTEQIFQDKVHNLLFEIKKQINQGITPDKRKSLENDFHFQLNEKNKSFYSQFILIEDYAHPTSVNFDIDEKLVQKRSNEIHTFLNKLKQNSTSADTLERIVIEYTQGRHTDQLLEVNSTSYMDVEAMVAEIARKSKLSIPYELGIKDLISDKWILLSFQADSTRLLESPYSTMVMDETEHLYIALPEKSDYFLQQLALYILGTILIGFFVIGSLWYIRSVILNQKKLSELKSDFINNMTHEFKTPIASIAFASANIENKKIIHEPEQILKFTEIIKKENKRMNRQVEQVLRAAIIDKKALSLNKEIFDVHEVIHQISDALEVKIKARGGYLARRLNAESSIIQGDKIHISNIISNLLDNAQKYSPNTPEVTIHSYDTAEGISISVSDKGKGLSEEEQERVFEKFYRVPTGNLHNVKGFGLGLSYSKAIAEQHGGKISLQSKLEKGSTFTLTLPLETHNS